MNKSVKISISALLAVAVICGGAIGFLYSHGLSGVMPKECGNGKIRVACVGDSVTYGHGISSWTKNNYPAVLSNLLGDEYTVQNFGNSGTTVQTDGDQPYTETKQYTGSLSFNADIIVYMLGSNDSKPKNWKDAKKFKNEQSRLIDDYVRTGAKVYICTSPTAHYKDENAELTSFEINPKIVNEIAQITREIAEEKCLPLIDINKLTTDSSLFLNDCVHPNKNGAKAIAEAICKTIK